LAYLRAVARESDLRDRAVEKLDLNPSQQDILIRTLYGPKPGEGEP